MADRSEGSGVNLSGVGVKMFAGATVALLTLTCVFSQEATLQIGYGRIETAAGNRVVAVALYSSSNGEGVLLWEAGVGAVSPIARGRVYVEQTGRTRTAVALVNTQDRTVELTTVLRDHEGREVDRRTLEMASGTQTARFVDEWFGDTLADIPEFLGTLTVESTDPEARFAAVTLRESINHRGERIYATLPVAELDAVELASATEELLSFPQVGGGGGLATQIVLVNPTETPIEGHVELFQADGSPLLLSLDGVESSEVPFSLEANGVFRAELTSATEVRSGYAVLSVDEGSPRPSGTALFQLKLGDHVMTEAGVPATVPTRHVRMLVDDVGTRTGVAVAPLGNAETPVRFDLKEIDGTPIASVEERIASVGHARYADEIFADLRPGFLGILEVSSEDPFAAVTLKLTTNRRGEPVLTTLPVADLSNPDDSGLLVIPQIGLGAGLETRLIVLGGDVSTQAQGTIEFVSFDATPMALPVFGTPQSSLSFEIAPGGGWRFDPTTPLEISDILLDSEITLIEGERRDLSPAVLDEQGVGHTAVPLHFQSTRPGVASVTDDGTLVGRKAGFATLIVSSGGVVRSTAVTVVESTSGLGGYTINYVDADSSGRLYLSSTPNQVILEAESLQATPITYAGIDQRAGFHDDLRLSALFDGPSFVALDWNTNRLYVSDRGNRRIRQVMSGTEGVVETLELNGDLGVPQGLALDDKGYLWVADSVRHTIGRIDLETNEFETIAGQRGAAGDVDGKASSAHFDSPHGLAVERESTLRQVEREARGEPAPPARILVADTGNGAIRRITRTSSEPDADWQVETLAIDLPNVATGVGRYRMQQSGSYFTSPTGISVDAAGNIYVSDQATGEVSLIQPSGRVVSALPAGTSAEDVAVTADGRVLVTEGAQGARELTYAAPEIQQVLRTPVGDNQERITIVGRNFSTETEVLVNSQIITDAVIVDSERITFLLPLLAINGGLIQVQNRGGLAQFGVPFPECEGPIVLDDPNLAAAVREALGLQSDEPITCEQAATLSSLDASNRGIQSLEGLQAFTGLNTLLLWKNQISDLTPLAGLTRLQYLSLGEYFEDGTAGGNQINDLSPLAGLTQLTDLRLQYNQIADISPLAGLSQLGLLDLSYNQIDDISDLAGLSQLGYLGLSGNQIADISVLEELTQLGALNINDNQIVDIGPLAELTQLWALNFGTNQVADISALAGLSELTLLAFYGNQIVDINPLSGLAQLTDLRVQSNQVADISALAELTQLARLELNDNQINEVKALTGLTQLNYLYLSDNQIGNISALAGLKQLTHLFLGRNQIADISPLAGLNQLEYLHLIANQIADVSALAGFTQLTLLDLGGNEITDISALAGLTQLANLSLYGNQIADISTLAGLTQLTHLVLDSNQIADISTLAGLTQLTELNLEWNQITDISALAGLTQLEILYLRGNLLGEDSCPVLQALIDRGVEVIHDVPCP